MKRDKCRNDAGEIMVHHSKTKEGSIMQEFSHRHHNLINSSNTIFSTKIPVSK